jgi:hypothetical protein
VSIQNKVAMASPAVTVLVVSDYEGPDEKSWASERAVLQTLARQDFAEPFEVILVEHEAFRDSTPDDVVSALPQCRVEFCAATTSAELKDEGVKLAKADVIAVLESDCTPAPEWLRHMMSALREHSDYAAVSGKTLYPGRSVFVRCLTLLDRSYLDPDGSGPTHSVCNNNSILHRATLEAYPYPAAPSPFLSAALRLHGMRKDGLRFFFESRAVVYHALPGWSFIKDMRRHQGYSMSAQVDGNLPKVLRGLAQRLYGDWKRCWRLRHHYAVAWYEVPLALALALVARVHEFKGAKFARQGPHGVPGTTYR